jgi:hypothetical protein
MNTNQAVTIIKQVLDQATKAGVLQNVEHAATVAQAWGEILKALKPNDKVSTN